MSKKLRMLHKKYCSSEQKEVAVSKWKPFPGKQAFAYDAAMKVNEMFFGGAAGGSKSCLIIGLALTRFKKSLILRRQATQLRELVNQLLEFAPVGSKWRGIGSGGILKTPDGREVELAGVPHEEDKRKFQGRPHQMLAFDEVCDFTESIVDYTSIWLRDPDHHCLRMMAGNPPTSSTGEWIIRRFRDWVDPTAGDKAESGEVRYYATIDGKEERVVDKTPIEWRGHKIEPMSRTFISSSLLDNPKLKDTNYASRLAAYPPAIRDAYLFGDFTVSLSDDAWQLIPTAWIKAAQARWKPECESQPMTSAGLDIAYGGSDKTVFCSRHGNWISRFKTWKDVETNSGEKVANFVAPLVPSKKVPINIDSTSWGTAAFEFLRKTHPNTVPVLFGSGAVGLKDHRDVLEFTNLRAYAYWRLRDALDPELPYQIALPPDDDLLAELASPRYSQESKKVKIESKDDIKQRLGRSPDKADAVALAVFEMPIRKATAMFI